MTDFLISDIGGTNARLAISTSSGIVHEEYFLCSDFAGISDVIKAYGKLHEVPERGLFAIAAPPTDPTSIRFTNIPHWGTANFTDAGKKTGVEINLVNDFYAQACATIALKPAEDYRTIIEGNMFYPSMLPVPEKIIYERLKLIADRPDPLKRIVVIGAGTGLGLATAHVNSFGQFVPMDGEGGHCAFSPKTQKEWQIFAEIQKQFRDVSCEAIASGPGLVRTFNAIEKIAGRTPWPDVTPEYISQSTSISAIETVDFFTKALARSSANAALITKSQGGVVISGGIAEKLGDRFSRDVFAQHFRENDLDISNNNFVRQMPVVVVTNPKAGLIGAHVEAQYHLAA